MNTVKTRKVGNSVTLTIPSELAVEAGKEFVGYRNKRGLFFAEKIANPFTDESIFEDVVDPFIDKMVDEELGL
jgi:hypothetical protein